MQGSKRGDTSLGVIGTLQGMGGPYGSQGSTLKGKLNVLQDQVQELAKELNYERKQVENLISEKETLERVLMQKTNGVRKLLDNEI